VPISLYYLPPSPTGTRVEPNQWFFVGPNAALTVYYYGVAGDPRFASPHVTMYDPMVTAFSIRHTRQPWGSTPIFYVTLTNESSTQWLWCYLQAPTG